MAWAVKNGWHSPYGSFSKKSEAEREARQLREANRQAGINGSVRIVKNPTNPSRNSIRLSNFTGIVTRPRGGKVTVKGKQRKKL